MPVPAPAVRPSLGLWRGQVAVTAPHRRRLRTDTAEQEDIRPADLRRGFLLGRYLRPRPPSWTLLCALTNTNTLIWRGPSGVGGSSSCSGGPIDGLLLRNTHHSAMRVRMFVPLSGRWSPYSLRPSRS